MRGAASRSCPQHMESCRRCPTYTSWWFATSAQWGICCMSSEFYKCPQGTETPMQRTSNPAQRSLEAQRLSAAQAILVQWQRELMTSVITVLERDLLHDKVKACGSQQIPGFERSDKALQGRSISADGRVLRKHSCLIAMCLCRCPDLHTMVLFVASLAHAKFLEIFLLQCHDNLSSLQVLLA